MTILSTSDMSSVPVYSCCKATDLEQDLPIWGAMVLSEDMAC